MKTTPCVQCVFPTRLVVRRFLRTLFALATALCCTAPTVQAAAVTGVWTGGGANGNWSNASNWSAGIADGGGQAYFNLPTGQMTVTIDTTGRTLGGNSAGAGGLVFTGSAYSGATGYTVNASGGATLTMGNSDWIEIDPAFMGSNITETIAAPIIMNAGGSIPMTFANWTAPSVSYLAGGCNSLVNAAIPAGVVATGTNNTLVLSGSSITMATGNNTPLWIAGPGNGTISGNLISGNAAATAILLDIDGIGTWTLSGSNSFAQLASQTTQVWAGTLALDFTTVSASNSKIGAYNNFVLGGAANGGNTGGTLMMVNNSGNLAIQAVRNTNMGPGANNISFSGTGPSVFYAGPLGAPGTGLPVAGATLNFNLPAGTQSGSNGVYVLTANADSGPTANGGVLGGWATVNQTDWATSGATATTAVASATNGWISFPGATLGQMVAFPSSAGSPAGFSSRQTYYVIAATSGSMQLSTIPGGAAALPTSAGAAAVVITGGNINPIATYATDTWASGTNTTVSGYASPSPGSTTNTLRFNANNGGGSNTLTLNGNNTINSGGILVTPNVTNPVIVTGGNLATNNTTYYFNQFSSAPLTVASNLTSNQPLVKSGAGTLILSGNNTGPVNQNIYVNTGTVKAGSAGALGSGSNYVQIGNTATLDLNGRSVTVRGVFSDGQNNSGNQYSGTLAANLGLTANVANSVPGTAAALTIGDANANIAGTTFYGGLTEAPGAILSLNYIGSGQGTANSAAGSTLGGGGLDGGAGLDVNNNGSWSNTITGGLTVGAGAVFGCAGGGSFNMDGAFTLNGGYHQTNRMNVVNTTYLAGTGLSVANAGNQEYLTLNHMGSVPDNFSGLKLGANNSVSTSFIVEFGGAGSYVAPMMFQTGGLGQIIGSTATVTTPGWAPMTVGAGGISTALNLTGQATLRLTGGAGSSQAAPTTIFGQADNKIAYGGGTLAIAPSGSGGSLYVQGGLYSSYETGKNAFYGGTTLLLDKGANNGMTFTLGDTSISGDITHMPNGSTIQVLQQSGYGTLVIAAAQGISQLGQSVKFNLFSYAPSLEFPSMQNGVVAPWIVGQDASAGAPTKPGTFLTYSSSGAYGTNGDGGFAPVNFINTNNLATAQATSLIEHITQSVSLPQATYNLNALQLDGAGITTLGTGSLAFAGTSPAAMILNSGTINGPGALVCSTPTQFDIYTSLGGGTINSNITAGSDALVKFGPGELTLTGTLTGTGAVAVNSGVLDVSAAPFTSGNSTALGGASVFLHGGVLQGSGTFTRTLGTSAGQMAWTGGLNTDIYGGGGFSAKGGPLTVSLTGGPSNGLLIWGMSYTQSGAQTTYANGYFLSAGGVLNFGSPDSNNVVTLKNNIELGINQGDDVGDSPSRVISVAAATADSGLDPLTVPDYAVLSGTIQSSGAYHFLVKDGDGVLVLGSSNTYSAGTQIANGTLVVSALDSAAGSGAGSNLGIAPSAPYPLNIQTGMNGGAITPGGVVIGGGAVLASATSLTAFTLNANRSLLLASGSTGANPSFIDVYTGNSFTVPSLIGDYMNEVGNLGKVGGGTLVVSGSQNNPFSGGLTITNGTVQNASPNSANVLGSGNVTFGTSNSPTLDLNGRSVVTGLLSGAGTNGLVTTTSNAVVTLTLAGSGTQSYAGTINNGSGTVALNVAGGSQILTGANAFSGAVTLSGSGTLQATNAGLNANDLTNGIVFNGGVLRAGAGGIGTAKAVAMTGAGTFDTNGNNSTLSGNITGAGGALSKAGSGTLVLSGLNNTFSGGLTVNNGTVQAGSGAGTAVLGSGNVSFGTANTPTVDLNGNSVTVGLLSGLVANGVINSSVTGPVTLTLAGSGNQVFGGSVQDGAGQLSLTVNSGTQILTGISSYSGETSVYGGSLTVTGAGAIPASAGLSIGGNGTFNFVTGTTGQVLTVQNLTTPYDSGTSSFGVEVGNSINVTNSPTGYRTLAVNLFGVLGTNPDPGHIGTQITVLTAPDSLDNYIAYILNNVYGATNFTVTGAPASNNPNSGFGNAVSMQITGANQLSTAYWKGSFGTANTVWAISNGSTAGNWTTNGSVATPLVPGATTDVTISGTASAGQEGNMSLGANMAINTLTVSDTNNVLLQDAFNTLSVSGTKGIAVNAGSGAVNLNAGLVLNGTASQALTANNATGLLISGVISSGANGISVNGTNTVTLAGNNTFTGPVTVSAGTLKLNGANGFTGTLTLSGGSLLNTTTAGINGTDTTNGIVFGIGGGTLQAAASGINTAKAVTMTGAGTIDASYAAVILSGALSGAGTLTKIGSNTLVMGGSNNAYTGGITINNGTVQLSNTNAALNGLTQGTLTFGPNNSPTLDLNDCSASIGSVLGSANNGLNGIIINNATDAGTGTLGISVPTGTTTFAASIRDGASAKVALTKNGAGTLILAGQQSYYTGGLTINQGTVQGVATYGSTAFGDGVVTFGTNNLPVLDLNGQAMSVGLLAGGTNATVTSVAASATLTLNGPGVQTFAGTITQATGKVTSLTMGPGAGTQILTGSNNFTGTISLQSGILNATNAAINATDRTNGIAFADGVLQAGAGGINTSKNVSITAQYEAGFDTNGNNIVLTGSISGGANTNFLAMGSGTLSLQTGSNGFVGYYDLVGGVTLNASTVSLNAANYVQMDISGGALQVTSGSTLTISKPLVLASANAGGVIDTNGNAGTSATISGTISGPGSLTLMSSAASGTMQLTGPNTFSGGLIIGKGTVLGSSTAQAGEFGSGDVTFGASNSPILDLNGQSVTTGLLSGTTGNGVVTSGVVGAGAITLTLTNTTSQSFAGVIQNGSATTLGLTKSGIGTQVLTGSNTYTGTLTLNNGILNATTAAINGGSLTNGIVFNSGTLQSGAGGLSTGKTVAMTGAGTFDTNGNSSALSGAITGAGLFVKAGAGTLTLSGTTATPFTGGITITGGILAGSGTSNANSTLGDITKTIAFNGAGATLQATGAIIRSGAITLTSAGIIDTQGFVVSNSGNVTGAGTLTKNGSGLLVLSAAANSFSGGLVINSGTVQAGNANSGVLGSGDVSFGASNTPTVDLNGKSVTTGLVSGNSNGLITSAAAGNITLTISNTDSQSFAGVIQTGSATSLGVTKLGAGTQILAGANTYTGSTIIGGGQLIVAGSLAGTNGVTLQNAAILGGGGSLNSAATIGVAATGGSVAPGNLDGSGNSTVGALTIGSMDLSAGGLNSHLSMQLGGAAQGAYDQVVAGGSINIAGADLHLSLANGYTPVAGDIFYLIISGASETGMFGSVNGITGTYAADTPFSIPGFSTQFELSYNASYNGGIASAFNSTGNDIALMAVPEPGTWALLLSSMSVLGLWQRRRSKI